MKRVFFISIVSVLALATACQVETAVESSSPVHQMTIHAGEAGTRTAVQFNGVEYHATWSAGDRIAVAEIIEGNFTLDPKSRPSPYQQVVSEDLPAAAATASFNVTLDDRSAPGENPTGDSFRYVGVYPHTGLYSVHWTGDNRAEWEAHWGNTTTPDHSTLLVELPTFQCPTADSFDPTADLMVSQVVASVTQPTSLNMCFARVGTIAKITLKGLPAGMTLESGTFSFDESWPGAYVVEYDPTLGKTGLFSKSSGQINFMPQDVTVDGSGNAVLWLRTLSGTLSGWFNFDITLTEGKGGKGGDPERYEKRVDLASLGRTITFPESGVATFSVTLEKHYDITMNIENLVEGETAIETDVLYNLGGKPHTTASYGMISFDPATPDPFTSVKYESAAPGDIIVLSPDGSGRAHYSASGLTPNTTYCFMPFVLLDGVAYYPEYSYFSFHTLVHYDYPEPALVDLGLPSGTKWASFNLGSNDPLTEGFYFAWGEVRPTESFTSSYSSKYWYQFSYSYQGYAKKYSTNAAFGQGNLLDMKTVLDPEDDAATVNLGGDWRTPTSADWGELFANCDRSGLPDDAGYVFTSRINGNSITSPNCGYYAGSSKQSRVFLMTSSLWVDGNSSRNSAWIADAQWSQNEYSEPAGSTRGYIKLNVRPVKGGERTGYTWTAHCADSDVSGGCATITGHFLVPEDLSNYTNYVYTAHLVTDPVSGDLTRQTFTRAGEYGNTIFGGLTPGTKYYYYVSWDCQQITNTSLHTGGSSEVRCFTAE